MTAAARKRTSDVVPDDDPLWQKFLAAPPDPNPVPEEEADGIAEALKHEGSIAGASVTAELARRAARAAPLPRRAR